MSEKITRRAALATTGRAALAVASGMSVAVADVGDQDAPLFALEADLDAAVARQEKAGLAHDAAEERCAMPERPKSAKLSKEMTALVEAMTISEFQKMPADHPYAVWSRNNKDADEKALAEWKDECERRESETGVDVTEAAWEASIDEVTAAAERILSRPATTLAGIMVKLRARQKAGMHGCHDGEQAVLNSIEIDLKAMTGLEDRS